MSADHAERLQNIAKGITKWCAFLAPIAEGLSPESYFGVDENGFRIYHASRADLKSAMALFPGKVWRKDDAGDGEARYTLSFDGDFFLVDCSELAPTCRVEWVDVEIPAQAARVEKKRKIICEGTREVSAA